MKNLIEIRGSGNYYRRAPLSYKFIPGGIEAESDSEASRILNSAGGGGISDKSTLGKKGMKLIEEEKRLLADVQDASNVYNIHPSNPADIKLAFPKTWNDAQRYLLNPKDRIE